MLRHFFFVNKNTLLVCVCVFLCHSDSHGDQWEWGAGVSREDRPSPATRRRPEARPSGQWTQVHGHLPETANLLLTLQRFYLVGHKTHRLDPTHLPSCFLHPTCSLCVCVCVSSDRGVLGKQGYQCQGEYFSLPASNFSAHHLLFKHENSRGITCSWVTAVIWSQATFSQSHSWPASHQQHLLLKMNSWTSFQFSGRKRSPGSGKCYLTHLLRHLIAARELQSCQ